MKRVIAIILLLILCCNTVFAAEKVKFYADIQHEFSPEANTPTVVEFINKDEITINGVTIPAGALINANICQFQKERRWHKSGFFICNLQYYSVADEEPVNLSEEEIYLIVRKYEAISKKDAFILGTEIVLTQAASIVGSCFIIFAPVDIAYFFTKGAIIRKKDPNWFKSGVMEAYDNSIFWFQLKGKPIELAEGDDIKLQSLTPEKAEKMSKQIEKRKEKKAVRQQRRAEKKEIRQQRREEKQELKQQRRAEKEELKQLTREERQEVKQQRREEREEIRQQRREERQELKQQRREEREELRQQRREEKQELKKQRREAKEALKQQELDEEQSKEDVLPI